MRYLILFACLGAMAVSCQLEEGEPAGELKRGMMTSEDYHHVTLDGEGGSEDYYIKVFTAVYPPPRSETNAHVSITKLDEMGYSDPCPEKYDYVNPTYFDSSGKSGKTISPDSRSYGEDGVTRVGDGTYFTLQYEGDELLAVIMVRVEDGNEEVYTYAGKSFGKLHKDTDPEKIAEAFREQNSESCDENDS